MITMRRVTRNTVIFFIIALSIYAGIQMTGFSFTATKVRTIDTKEADSVFNEAKNFSKSVINYTTNDIDELGQKLNQVVMTDGVKKYYYVKERGSLVAVIEVSEELRETVVSGLHNLPGLENEKTETALTSDTGLIDTASHIELNKDILKRYRERLSYQNLTTREIGELQNSIRNIQTKIDSLSSIHTVELARKNQLIMVIARQHAKSGTSSQLKKYFNLGKWSVTFMVIFSIGAIIIYFFFYLLTKLSRALGIRSPKSGGRYGYSYGSKYSYSPKKRKYVKKSSSGSSSSSEKK